MVDGSYCTVPCDFLSGGICPSPMTCQPAEGGMCGYCSCSAGRLGDSCEADGQCQAGTCGEEYGLNACVQDCTDPGLGCPAGFACIPVPDGSRSVCLPGKASMGQSCTQDSDCFDGQCIAHGGTMACTRRCDRLGCTCPQGFDCVDTAGSFAVCAASGEVTSGCGCSVPGARSGTPWPVALLGALITLAILLGRDRPRLPRATRSPPGTADPRNHP
jgi:MYXO-CTERM domain-containing protein